MLKPSLEKIKQHLDIKFDDAKKVYSDGLIEIQALPPNFGEMPPIANLFPVYDTDKAAERVFELNNKGYNLYFGVNPRKPGTVKNGTNEDIEISFWQFADFDTLESLENFKKSKNKPLPSIKVITGEVPHKRFHAYYHLENPCNDMVLWSQIQSGIIAHYKSDKVKDPRRIMRLTGTVSYPSRQKIEKGYQTSLVRIDNANF